MSSSASQNFQSIDEGHYFNSESLILQEVYGQSINQSVSQIKLSQSIREPNLQHSNSFKQQIENLILQQTSTKQSDEIKKSVEKLSEYQKCLYEKMEAVTGMVSEGNRKQDELKVLLHKLKFNLESPCDVQQHANYQKQLLRNKELMEQSQKQLEVLLQNLKYNEKKTLDPSEDDARTPVRLRPLTDDDTVGEKSMHKITKFTQKQSMDHIIADQGYSQNPKIQMYKKLVIEKSVMLYSDEKVRVTLQLMVKGLKIKLKTQYENAVLNIRNSKGKSLILSWDQFGQSKRGFEECQVEVPSKQQIQRFEIVIPLPLSFLLQKRLKGFPRIPMNKLKQSLACHRLSIKYFDEQMWQKICTQPELVGLNIQDQKLINVFNIRNHSSIHLTELYLQTNTQQLQVDIYYKSNTHLEQLVQFYKYLLCK